MHSLRRVIIVKRVYEMKKMCCVFNDIFRFVISIFTAATQLHLTFNTYNLTLNQSCSCHFSWLFKAHNLEN